MNRKGGRRGGGRRGGGREREGGERGGEGREGERGERERVRMEGSDQLHTENYESSFACRLFLIILSIQSSASRTSSLDDTGGH